MSEQIYYREPFEVELVPGSSNTMVILVDYLDAQNEVDGPFDGSEFDNFWCQCSKFPTRENPEPTPLLHFSVVHLPGYIPEVGGSAHDGAFMLQCDPTASKVLQKQFMQEGVIDLFGGKSNGERKYIARGHFHTTMVATREFE